MRKYSLFVICLIAITTAHAQDASSNLALPSTPAFSILNFEPSSVMKPVSYKDLSTDVINSFDKNGKLLMNLGLEVTPYWLSSHTTLNRGKYLNPFDSFGVAGGLGHTILQSFSISAATVKDSSSGNNKLGVGFRFKVLNGKRIKTQDSTDNAVSRTSGIISIISTVKNRPRPNIDSAISLIYQHMTKEKYSKDTISAIMNDAHRIASSFPNNPSGVILFADSLENFVQTYAAALGRQAATLAQQRTGWILEFAGASAFNMAGNNSVERLGAWMNLSRKVSTTDMFTFTARYMWHNSDTLINNFDAGLAYTKTRESTIFR
jgi:hypothetical protein